MNAIALTKIEGKHFKVLSCQQLFSIKNKQTFFHDKGIKSLLKPLVLEKFDNNFIKQIEWEMKNSSLKLFNMPEEVGMLDFKNKGKKYKIYFHKIESVIFCLLLYQLSAPEIRDIRSKTIKELSLDEMTFNYVKNKTGFMH